MCGNTYLNVQHNVIVFSKLIFQNGVTALMFAIAEGRSDIVELLIKHKADVNARTEVRLHNTRYYRLRNYVMFHT